MPTAQTLHHPATEVLFASAARTATVTGDAKHNHEAAGVLLFVDVTAINLTPAVTPKIQASFDNGTTWVDYWIAAAAIAATGDFTYLLYPGATGGNLTEVDGVPLPRLWRLVMTHGDADSATYDVRAMYL